MKKTFLALTIFLLALGAVAQVNSRISTRTGTVNQLEAYGRVSYLGLNYYPVGKDSLLVKNDRCKADSVLIPPVLTIDKKPYTVCGFREMAFEYDNDIEYINIPSSITEIANSSFYSCHDLSECVMPSVKVIQGYAFFRTGFKRLTLHEGLQYIGGSAFTECSHLEYLELPNTLEYIGDDAFLGCEQLDTVKVHFSQPIDIGSDVFWLYRPNTQLSKKVLIVPAGSKPAFEAHKQWQLFQTIIEY